VGFSESRPICIQRVRQLITD